jgi:hypothetical protein
MSLIFQQLLAKSSGNICLTPVMFRTAFFIRAGTGAVKKPYSINCVINPVPCAAWHDFQESGLIRETKPYKK